ncbi:WEB family protein At2g38370 [Rutidosis leptorrhynchoides]|uniref:WEB family protein At2g38370 n=1 Tax=Rutidosis leptorrhynchoides TaxID=125765 RepID=UPI003A990216
MEQVTEAIDSGHNVGSGYGETGMEQKQSNSGGGGGVRGEVDTSAPFESVKEAVTRFGGVGFWKPHLKLHENGCEEEFDASKAEKQATELANDLMIKERETLEVLKELDVTKTIVEELKVKLQKESSKVNVSVNNCDSLMCPSSAPGLILMELKQAKMNLTRTTNDLADIRLTVETYNKKIEKERFELEKTRQRLSSNSSPLTKISFFDETVDFPKELHRLTCETEQFKKVTEVAKSEVLRSMNEIKQTKRKIKTANIRLVAARKLKEAARASEALARSELKSISKSQTLTENEGVTLSFEEYSYLKLKAREADESLLRKVNESMVKVNESEVSKSEILNKIEEAKDEVKKSKRVLEEALSKAEAANKDKLKAEESLRKWRSDHGQRRKSTVQNSTKFKTSSSKSNTRLLDVNGAHLGCSGSGPVLRPTMSIGQILSRKLLLTEEYCEKNESRKKISLAQMLSKASDGGNNGGGGGDDGGSAKRRSGKRKKFGFGRISFMVTKPSKKKKKHSISSRLSCSED